MASFSFMYSLVVRERECACGQSWGIFSTREKAKEAAKRKFPCIQWDINDGETAMAYPYLSPNSHKGMTEVHILEVLVDTWIEDGLNGCARCLTCTDEEEEADNGNKRPLDASQTSFSDGTDSPPRKAHRTCGDHPREDQEQSPGREG